MIIETIQERANSLTIRGRFGFTAGVGMARCGYIRCGADKTLGGIYSRKVYGTGVSTIPAKRGARYAISRMRYYRPTNNQLAGQQAWRAVFADGMAQYALLTADEKALLSKEARKTRMLGFNLFMSRWLQSHRA